MSVPPSAIGQAIPDDRQLLAGALLNAGRLLGLSQSDVARVVGRDRSSLSRGLDPGSKPGELALLLIRCYRSLYVLTGGEPGDLKHWMHTRNDHTGGVPAEQVRTVQGLVEVAGYLDAMRGRL